MSRSWIAILFLFAGSEPAFASAKKVDAGVDCRQSPQEALENLAEDVANAKELAEHGGRKCLEKDDPHREADEQRELERIEKQMKSEIDDICTKKNCVGNPTALATQYDPYNVFNTFGGCSQWAIVAAVTVAETQYFNTERVQRCRAPFLCHFVLVMENPRTGERRTLDPWSYAGGWGARGAYRESEKRGRSVYGSVEDFEREYLYESFTDSAVRGTCNRKNY